MPRSVTESRQTESSSVWRPYLPTICGLLAVNAMLACAIGVIVFLKSVPATADTKDPSATAPSATDSDGNGSALSYEHDVKTFVAQYCGRCHGGEERNAEIAFSDYADEQSLLADRKIWGKVLEMLQSGDMPPDDAPQPPAEKRDEVANWLDEKLYRVDCQLPRDPGRVTVRRLNRAEYNNTIRDLVGVDFKPAEDFPSDDVGEGFDNIGDVLSISPLLFEKYLDAAEKIAESAIVAYDPASGNRQFRQRNDLSQTGAARLDDYGVYNMYSAGSVFAQFEFPRDGQYVLRAEAGADQAGPEVAKMQFTLDAKPVAVIEVKAPADDVEAYEFRLKVEKGRRKFDAAFINDYYKPDARDPRQRDRNLYIRSLEVAGPVDIDVQNVPKPHRRIVIARPENGKTVDQAANEVLSAFMRRAFRRPVSDDEVHQYAQLVELAMKQGDSYERGIQVAVAAVLVSPHFLFRIEQDPDPNNPAKKHGLNDYELASRLSYFLWSSMPDDELFTLAEKGELHRDDVLEQQVRRMLNDPKSQALVENFATQWLNLRNLDLMSPDPDKFSAFDDQLRADMQQETQLFFAAVMREDRSILDFIDGRFTFVNERLAQHYGLPNVKSEEFRRVELNDGRRAGVLTHASVLTLTSNPTRTSPVKRGKWIMENILGTPPPEPPPEVPELEEVQKANPNASLREQLELHRSDMRCSVCHVKMDPLGLAFENFDAIGRWRDKDGKFDIDASGKLPSGESFNGPGELVRILRQREDQFSRSLAEKMLTFALGRGLEYFDRCTVDDIINALKANDHRFSTLVIEIVKSEPFRMRRGES